MYEGAVVHFVIIILVGRLVAKARHIASVRSTKRPPRPGSRPRGKDDRRSRGVFSKAELDACHVVDREHSSEEYKKLTALQKQKLWTLRNGNKEPGTGPQRPACSVAAASSSSPTTKKRDRSQDKTDMSDIDDADDTASHSSSGKWGRNRDNPAVAGRQPSSLKSEMK